MKAFIGTFYKTAKKALKKMEEKNKVYGREEFIVCGFKQGYMVISKRQADLLESTEDV